MAVAVIASVGLVGLPLLLAGRMLPEEVSPVRAAVLTPTDDPGADPIGHATLIDGALDVVVDLPPAAVGAVYDVWLSSRDGSEHRRLGPVDGRAGLPVGRIDADRFNLVEITVGNDGDDPASPGQVIARGRLD
ncbi:MAG: hypothetical protein ACK5RL_01900 [Acidimicrobiales bacterium]